MTHSKSRQEPRPPRLRGVTELPESHGAHRYRVRISRGKGQQVNLGLYATPWLAAFAYNVAAEALHGDGRARNAIPESQQPDADQVQAIKDRVRRRLGLEVEGARRPSADRPPPAEELLTLFEITVVGFWRAQVADGSANPARELEIAARRLVEAANALFWSHTAGHPAPLEALATVLGRRLDRTFRLAELTREVLDDEGDDALRIARWLAYPDDLPGGAGFFHAIGQRYGALMDAETRGSSSSAPSWASVLGIVPPFTSAQVRNAYRTRSKSVHPDTGGDHGEFVRLQSAYEEAQRFCTLRGL